MFAVSLISSYGPGLHLGAILGFGWHGAKQNSPTSLQFYVAAKVLFLPLAILDLWLVTRLLGDPSVVGAPVALVFAATYVAQTLVALLFSRRLLAALTRIDFSPDKYCRPGNAVASVGMSMRSLHAPV